MASSRGPKPKAAAVRLLDVEKSGIKVASYWTEALPQEQLEGKLHEAVQSARAQVESRQKEYT